MSTTLWVILFLGVAATFAASVAARRNIVPATIPWLVVLVTAIVVMYNLKPGPFWGWLLVVLIVLAIVACLWRFVVAVVALAVLAIVAMVMLGSLAMPANSTIVESAKAPLADAKAKVVPAIAVTCDKKFVQVAGNNARNRVDADFEKKVATAVATNKTTGLKNVILTGAANNGQRLAIWANAFGLKDDPNVWKLLVSGDCLSAEGQTLFNKLDGALSATGVSFTSAQAPATGYNTGVSNGRFGVSETPGVTGNRDSIKVTLRDKSMIYLLKRCGNVVRPGKVGLPPAKTDNPVPPKVNPPRVVPPCPPGQVKNQNSVCVTPKSSNPNAYQAPGRDNTRDSGTGVKPRVPLVTTQPESSPPLVVTSQVGGGGVIDTATNAPGSETGVTAPGAVPAPTTATPVPAPEPSVNPTGGINLGDPGNPFQ